MSITLKCILVLAFFTWIIWDSGRQEEKERRRIDKIKGCTCPKSFWNEVSWDCPVHNPFYIREYIAIDKKLSYDHIHASYSERIPICEKCLEKIKPKGYIIEWPEEITRCHYCGKVEKTKDLPIADLNKWKQWKEEFEERKEKWEK